MVGTACACCGHPADGAGAGVQGCSASPHSDDNLFVWGATIFGPDETPWEARRAHPARAASCSAAVLRSAPLARLLHRRRAASRALRLGDVPLTRLRLGRRVTLTCL